MNRQKQATHFFCACSRGDHEKRSTAERYDSLRAAPTDSRPATTRHGASMNLDRMNVGATNSGLPDRSARDLDCRLDSVELFCSLFDATDRIITNDEYPAIVEIRRGQHSPRKSTTPPAEEEAMPLPSGRCSSTRALPRAWCTRTPTGLLPRSLSGMRRDSGDLIVGGLEGNDRAGEATR